MTMSSQPFPKLGRRSRGPSFKRTSLALFSCENLRIPVHSVSSLLRLAAKKDMWNGSTSKFPGKNTEDREDISIPSVFLGIASISVDFFQTSRCVVYSDRQPQPREIEDRRLRLVRLVRLRRSRGEICGVCVIPI